MKRVLIYSTGYHSRLIFRSQKKNYIILGFLDQNKKIEGRKIFNKYKVYHSLKHKNLDYDKILIAGFSDKQIKEIKKINTIDSKKIIKLKKIDIIPKKKILVKREKKLIRLIKSFTKIMKGKYDYIFTHSSLLAILRKDDFSYYSDVDVVVLKDDFNKIYLYLKKNLQNYLVKKYEKKYSKKITISEKRNIYNLEHENIVLDIMALFTNKKKYIFRSFNKKLTTSIPIFHFKNRIYYKYKKINFAIPYKINDYMKLFYKEKWFKKPKNWNL
jgi:hypothetical protein